MIFLVLERSIRTKNSNFDKNLIKLGVFFFDKMNGVYASFCDKIMVKTFLFIEHLHILLIWDEPL